MSLKDGKITGVLTTWSKDGQKEFEINYKNGKKHGPHILWNNYNSGLKNTEITFQKV